MTTRRVLAFFLALLLAGPAARAVAAATPTEQIRQTVDAVIEVLRNRELTGEARRQQLAAVIRPRFDFQLMSQWVLGTNWRKASPAQRERFVELFTDTLEATYIGKIEKYTDEQVRYTGETVKDDRGEVTTLIVTRSAQIPISYKVFRRGEEWFVYDVVVENVSLVRNYRSTYDEIVRKEGIDGLLSRMQEKLREREAGKAA